MSDTKIQKLEAATATAKSSMTKAKEVLDDASLRLNTAKQLLRQLDEEEQQKIQVNDTKLPELLEFHAIARLQYEQAKTKYETNLRYLVMYTKKQENE